MQYIVIYVIIVLEGCDIINSVFDIQNMYKLTVAEFDSIYKLKFGEYLGHERFDILMALSDTLVKLLKCIEMNDISRMYDKKDIIISFANKSLYRQSIRLKCIESEGVDYIKHYQYFGVILNDDLVSRAFDDWAELKKIIESTEKTNL